MPDSDEVKAKAIFDAIGASNAGPENAEDSLEMWVSEGKSLAVIAEALKAEREACAVIAEDWSRCKLPDGTPAFSDEFMATYIAARREAADAIRGIKEHRYDL